MFCPQIFGSAAAKDDHTLEHFAQETCTDCNQNLIRIGSNLYIKHSEATCIRRQLKSGGNSALADEVLHEIKTEGFDELSFLKDCYSDYEGNCFGSSQQCESNPLQEQNAVYLKLSTDKRSECDICGNFFHPAALWRHKKVKHGPPEAYIGEFQCQVCMKIFTQKSYLSRHIRLMHNPNRKTYNCEVCFAVFMQKSSLDSHPCRPKTDQKYDGNDEINDIERFLDVQIKVEQTMQDNELTGVASIEDEIEMQTGTNILSNRNDDENENQNEDNLNGVSMLDSKQQPSLVPTQADGRTTSIHKTTVGQRAACNICGKVYHPASLYNHKKNKHALPRSDLAAGLAEFQCYICKIIVNKKEYLRKHMRFRHDPNRQIFRCKPCHQVFFKESSLENHVLKHTIIEEKNVDCEICGKSIRLRHLRRHIRVLHRDPDKPFCKYCVRIFTSFKDLQDHMPACISKQNSKRSRKRGQFPCNVCEKVFTESYYRAKHQRRVHANSLFKCNVCRQAFVKQSSLAAHKCLKDQPKTDLSVICDICGQMVANKYYLRRHKIVKHSECSHICHTCALVFSSADELATHKIECKAKRYPTDRIFQCYLCQKIFKANEYLRRHLRNVHDRNGK